MYWPFNAALTAWDGPECNTSGCPTNENLVGQEHINQPFDQETTFLYKLKQNEEMLLINIPENCKMLKLDLSVKC